MSGSGTSGSAVRVPRSEGRARLRARSSSTQGHADDNDLKDILVLSREQRKELKSWGTATVRAHLTSYPYSGAGASIPGFKSGER
jgi:hypothetical protein